MSILRPSQTSQRTWAYRQARFAALLEDRIVHPEVPKDERRAGVLEATSRLGRFAAMDDLDRALQCVLIDHLIAIETRQAAETRPLHSPDLSDIYADTREKIRSLCSGELNPRSYLRKQDLRMPSQNERTTCRTCGKHVTGWVHSTQIADDHVEVHDWGWDHDARPSDGHDPDPV